VTATPRRRRQRVAVAGALVVLPLLVVLLLFDSYQMTSDRMQPTLHAGDRVLARPITGEEARRGDVVVVRLPAEGGGGGEAWISRVVALAGEEVALDGGEVTVVPDGSVWVRSDDRDTGVDSRHVGPIPHEDVYGRVVLRWWPLRAFGGL
jgi:signal peptidase I